MYSEWQALPPPPPLPAPLGVNRNLQGDTILGKGEWERKDQASGGPGDAPAPVAGSSLVDKERWIICSVDSAQASNPRTAWPRAVVIYYKGTQTRSLTPLLCRHHQQCRALGRYG